MTWNIGLARTIAACLALALTGTNASAQAILSAAPPEIAADPDGRLAIGRGADYVPDPTDPTILAADLASSMKKRRDFGWAVIEKMLAPQTITLLDGVTSVEVPLWQTWYEGGSKSEVRPLLGLYFSKLKPALAANPAADVGPVIAETMQAFSEKNLSETLTDDSLSQELLQFRDTGMQGLSDRLGRGFTSFSPSFVEHVLHEARGIEECDRTAAADDPPPSADQFSSCIDEFPRSAVMVKTSWAKLQNGIPEHDTSGPALTDMFRIGTWPAGTRRTPTQDQIYTNLTATNVAYGLRSIHFVTKDVREWVWVSLWWDPNAATEDFGSDQPASLASFNNGVWKNYKLCVSSAFAEQDPAPWSTYEQGKPGLAASLKAVSDAIEAEIDSGSQSDPAALALLFDPVPTPIELAHALTPAAAPYDHQTSWCSNPNVETHPGNGRTSCIGCHQFPMTRNEERNDPVTQFGHAIVGDFPQFGRAQYRKNFPAEFAWSFEFEFQGDILKKKQETGFQWPPA